MKIRWQTCLPRNVKCYTNRPMNDEATCNGVHYMSPHHSSLVLSFIIRHLGCEMVG